MAKKTKTETSTVVSPDGVNMLTGDLQAALTQLGLTPEQEQQALQAFAATFRKTGEQAPPRPEFKLFNIEPGTPVMLSDLIGLDDTPIPDAAKAMRDINKDNVTSLELAYEAGSDVPAIEIVGSTWGMIVLNGYHRWEAMENLVKREFVTPDGKLAKDGKEQFERQLTRTQVEYKPFYGSQGDDPTAEDVLNYATFANLKNGLQVSKQNRSRLALWYQARVRSAGGDISYGKLSLMFGVSKPAISQQATRDMLKTHPEMAKGKLPADVVITDEAEIREAMAELKEREASKIDPLEASVKALIKACVFMYTNVDSGDDLARYVQGFVKNSDEYYALQFVESAITMIEEPETEPVEA